MKKHITWFAACALAAMLAGCSSASSEETQSTAAETTQAETAAQTTEAAEETAAESEEVSLEAPGASETLRIGSLKGPTSMGLVSLMDLAEKGESEGSYTFTMVTDASELSAQMVAGDLDIALVPANMASILYQKTEGGVQLIDINTLGVLYVVSADTSIQSIADLAGKTVYMTGKGTTPEYAFNYLLSANGLSADDVTIEFKSEATEVAAILKEPPDAIGLLPQPFVTVAMSQNENLQMVLDLTEEWDKVQAEDGGSLVTGVTVCRSQVLEEQPEAVDRFIAEHKASTEFANTDVEAAAELVAAAGIIEKAPVAVKAMPYCSIVCIDGSEMKDMVSGYLSVLYEQDPASVGGALPDDAFYYLPRPPGCRRTGSSNL